MSSLICSNNCPSVIDLTNYQDLCLPDSETYLKDGIKAFGLILKDTATPITDRTDLAQWQILKDAGEIIMGPCGVTTLGNPSSNTSTDIKPCNVTTVIETVYQPIFHTYNLDPENYEHCRYFENLANGYECYGIIFFDCYGVPILNTQGDDVWFDISIIVAPHRETGDQGKQKWVTQFEIKKNGIYVMCSDPIEDLYDLLTAA